MRKPKTRHLVCPAQVSEDGDLCEHEVVVFVTPPLPARGWDPPEGGELEVVEAHCEHGEALEKGQYDDDLWQQLEEGGDDD